MCNHRAALSDGQRAAGAATIAALLPDARPSVTRRSVRGNERHRPRALLWLLLGHVVGCGATGNGEPVRQPVMVPVADPSPAQPSDSIPPPEPVTLALQVETPAAGPNSVKVTLQRLLELDDGRVDVELMFRRGARTGKLELRAETAQPLTGAWCGLRFTLLDVGEDRMRATFRVEGAFALAPVVRLNKKERAVILPDLVVTLDGHSHKSMMAGDGESPLMVAYTRHTDTGDHHEYVNIFNYETREFKMNDITLELVDHEYGAWMDVRVISTP